MASQQTASAAAASTLDRSTRQTPAAAQTSAPQPPTGLLDLEKELTCSICTDILYQPLTLLDCLHTFCGSCLKEWFSWQTNAAKQKRRQQGRSPSSQNLYTCPSCRSSVRGTRPNATVTTLLDMFLQANPTRAKSDEEKKEVAEHFKPGESVIPPRLSPSPARPSSRRRQQEEEDDDRRLVEEVRQMSLRELERTGTRASRGEGERRRQERNRRRDEIIGASAATTGRGDTRSSRRDRLDVSPRPSSDHGAHSRSLEHQSSLRSLISTSELDSQEMEEEIMRQILEEGLLDGVDLSNINRSDEDAISERIAQAYRRRQQERERALDRGGRRSHTERPRDELRHDQTAGPPSSYRHGTAGFVVSNAEPRHDQRSSSQGSSRSGRVSRPARSSSEEIVRAENRSATDLSAQPETVGRQHRRVTSQDRGSAATAVSAQPSDRGVANSRAVDSTDSSFPVAASQQADSSQHIVSTGGALRQSSSQTQDPHSIPTTLREMSTPHSNDGVAVSSVPIRSCSSCMKPGIQHDLHYVCSQCPPPPGFGIFALCLRCYRLGKGCPSRRGLGNTARLKFRQQAQSSVQTAASHVMTAERFIHVPGSGPGEEGLNYHQIGVFCDTCCENANTCYWQCDVCNEGEWGFCNKCVNQARHCTHTLLSLAWSVEGGASNPASQSRNGLVPLPVHTSCNVCNNPIPPSNTRFHCPICNDGDYDICTSCYRSAVSSGQFSPANGPKGWRKCENGHRMLLIGFESRPEGQHRVVVENVVGGWQMREEDAEDSSLSQHETTTDCQGKRDGEEGLHWSWRDTSSGGWKHKAQPKSLSSDVQGSLSMTSATGFTPAQRFPPPGGFGFKMTAMWTRVPDEGVEDELMFPKWAEITEVVDINEDWCWGIYCKQGGLFPESFGRVTK